MQEKLLIFVESELSKEFEVPDVYNVKDETPKEIKSEEIFVKIEPEDVPDEDPVDFVNFDAELEIQKAFEDGNQFTNVEIAEISAPEISVTSENLSEKIKVEKKKNKSKKNLTEKPKIEGKPKNIPKYMCVHCGKLVRTKNKLDDHIAG